MNALQYVLSQQLGEPFLTASERQSNSVGPSVQALTLSDYETGISFQTCQWRSLVVCSWRNQLHKTLSQCAFLTGLFGYLI
ncbi:hypothetical protein L596_013413 [Steinernema carpocapsae]|uniref:Uncharacterized protein n=1 Tax=Steinernema carpocapsae TaxID=34508 RepID=A0A4U5P0Y5_STECR|nr:hypothetical protein L596_013413 [Steinernema carpocapsae]